MRQLWIGVDWDHTLIDSASQALLPGALEALETLRAKGYKILIHSANNPHYIRQFCNEHGIVVDGIWGEQGEVGKPDYVACFIDDRAVPFRGGWQATLAEVLGFVDRRPVKR